MVEQAAEQPNVNIDGKEYEWNSLPEVVRSELRMILHIDGELKKIQQTAYIYQTAKNAYLASIKHNLDSGDNSGGSAPDTAKSDTDSIDFGAFNLS